MKNTDTPQGKGNKKREHLSHRTREEVARTLIDRMLADVGWNDDQIEPGRARYPEQEKALDRKSPDYVLYPKEGRVPLAIVEAKKPNKKLKDAITQGIGYAKALKCPVVFASDGSVVISVWVANGLPLIIDDQKVKDLLSPDKLSHFAESNVWDRGDTFRSSGDLVNLFNSAGKQLNRGGITKMEAFNEFANLIFVKILTELCDDGNDMFKQIPARWDGFSRHTGEKLIKEYNLTMKSMRDCYGVGFEQTKITNPDILEQLVGLLEQRSFIGTDADIKGAAYEYFLRDYTKAKDELNRYFTPRHIVDMMVSIINPETGERIYDPFCGTGGMLIQSFRHLKKRLPREKRDYTKQLNKLQREMLWGRDICEAAHFAKMNMILAGDGHTNIERCDSTIDKVTGMDVVITNIPFSARQEPEFIKTCLDAIRESKTGRAAIIVPESIVSGSAHVDFRRSILDEWSVDRVVSLPREVFAEYTGAKTSVLFLRKKEYGSEQKKIQVYKIERDGMKGKTRRLPDLDNPNDIEDMLSGALSPVEVEVKAPFFLFNTVQVSAVIPRGIKIQEMRFGDLVDKANRQVEITPGMECLEPGSDAKENKIVIRKRKRYSEVAVAGRKRFIIKKGDLVVSLMHTQAGHIAYSDIDEDLHSTGTHRAYLVRENLVDKRYLFWAARRVIMSLARDDVVNRETYNEDEILNLIIPVPSLPQQRKIAKQIDTIRENIIKAELDLIKSKNDFDDNTKRILPFDILVS